SEMSRIKDFNVTYEAISEDHAFSEGDTIVGTVNFRLTKDVKVKSVFVKAKGDSIVKWTESCYCAIPSRTIWTYKFNHISFAGTSLPQGAHTFKFRLKIPEGNMPSSFQGKHGKIVYVVEAKISRSWHLPSAVQKEIKFVSKAFLNTPQVMCPQSSSVSKDVGVFSKGQVQMSATISRGVCFPGETLSVVAKICNSSSKHTSPKFKLEQNTVYRSKYHTKNSLIILFKEVGETISPNSERTVSCQLKIPDDAISTIHNCEIISVEYYIKVLNNFLVTSHPLRNKTAFFVNITHNNNSLQVSQSLTVSQVYLDISFAVDPEVVLSLVIVPSRFAAIQPGEAVGAYPPGKRHQNETL
uniref:Arrestin C-terminal-like domain-containing protein n=1 Tax=Maylandia zebra TaxID=106582 RepID=A0A3P9C9B3_9CICH